jgi:hypothetical protein
MAAFGCSLRLDSVGVGHELRVRFETLSLIGAQLEPDHLHAVFCRRRILQAEKRPEPLRLPGGEDLTSDPLVPKRFRLSNLLIRLARFCVL